MAYVGELPHPKVGKKYHSENIGVRDVATTRAIILLNPQEDKCTSKYPTDPTGTLKLHDLNSAPDDPNSHTWENEPSISPGLLGRGKIIISCSSGGPESLDKG